MSGWAVSEALNVMCHASFRNGIDLIGHDSHIGKTNYLCGNRQGLRVGSSVANHLAQGAT